MLKTGDVYKDFYVIRAERIRMYKNAWLYQLRHRTTGLEIHYAEYGTVQNAFVISFRTPATDNSGVFHVLEHSVLDASRKFPYSNTFSYLCSNALYDYMNARTTRISTNFFASSYIQSEALKFFDAFMNCVFFPNLTENVFMREGWRIEEGRDGGFRLNGTVLNEMRFDENDFALEGCLKFYSDLYGRPTENFMAGGNPNDIPKLTYGKLLQAHKKYYRPDNCAIYYRSGMSVTSFVDMFSDKYIPGLSESFSSGETLGWWKSRTPHISDDIRKNLFKKNGSENLKKNYVFRTSDKTKESLCDFVLEWTLGDFDVMNSIASYFFIKMHSRMEKAFKAVDDKIIFSIYSLEKTADVRIIMAIGNVRRTHKRVIQKKIHEILSQCINGKDFDEYICDFFNDCKPKRFKDIQIVSEDSLTVKLIRWELGLESDFTYEDKSYSKLKSKIFKKSYVHKILSEKFLENRPSEYFISYTYYDPKKFLEEQVEKFGNVTLSVLRKTDLPSCMKKMEEYRIWCSKDFSGDLQKLYKRISLNDTVIKKYQHPVKTWRTKNNVPCIGVTWNDDVYRNTVRFMFPADRIKPELMSYMDLLASAYVELFGRNEYLYEGYMKFMYEKNFKEMHDDSYDFRWDDLEISNRNFFVFEMEFSGDKTEKVFSKFREENFISGLEFTEEQKKKCFDKIKVYSDNEIKGRYNLFAFTRLYMGLSLNDTVDELLSGYSRIPLGRDWIGKKNDKHFEKLSELYGNLLDGGCLISVQACKKYSDTIEKKIAETVEVFGLKPLRKKINRSIEDYMPYVYAADKHIREFVEEKTGVGVCRIAVPLPSTLNSVENLAEDLLCSWISINEMVPLLRDVHGCYSADSYNCNLGYMIFMTNQDPDPKKSVEIIHDIVARTKDKVWTEDEIQATLFSVYKGSSFNDCEYNDAFGSLRAVFDGTTTEFSILEQKRNYSLTPDNLHGAAVRLYNNMGKMKTEIVFPNS